MTTPAPTAEPTPPVDPAIPDDAFQHALHLLLDAGTKLVQDLVADPATPAADKAEPYERLARSIRRTIALARHIAESPAKRTPSPAERRSHDRRQVLREVENAIDARVEQPEYAESLRDDLNERLDDPEFDRDLATRPISDIIRDLKRDLGLERNLDGRYTRRTPAHIRALQARAAAPPKPPPEPDAPEPGRTRPNARSREPAAA